MATIGETAPAPAAPWYRYQGWRMVVIAFIIFFFAFGGPISSMPMLYDEVMKEFGWTLTQATFIYTVASGAGAIMAIFVIGKMVERFGLRPVLLTTITFEATGLALFSLVDSMATYYLAGLMIGLGQGTTLIGLKLLVSRWFTRNVALAGAIALVGGSLGGVVYPFVTDALLPAIGWRYTFASLSLGLFFIAIPLCFAARYNPTEADVLPEAATSRNAALSSEAVRAAELDMTFGEIIRRPTFWRIAIAIWLVAAVDQGLFQHTVLFFTRDVGLDRTVAASALSLTFIVGLVAKFASGRMFDKLSVNGVAIWYLFVAAAAALAFPVQGVVTAMIFATARGVVHGGLVSEGPVLSKHVYGAKHLTRILPIFSGCFATGSATGPVTVALIYDATGGYTAAFILCIAVSLFAALLLTGIRPLYLDRLRAAGA